MAAKPKRYALGFLFVTVATFAVVHYFRDRIINAITPYTGGRPVCADDTAEPAKYQPFGITENCLQINSTASTIVNTTEVALLVASGGLILYLIGKWLVRAIARNRARR